MCTQSPHGDTCWLRTDVGLTEKLTNSSFTVIITLVYELSWRRQFATNQCGFIQNGCGYMFYVVQKFWHTCLPSSNENHIKMEIRVLTVPPKKPREDFSSPKFLENWDFTPNLLFLAASLIVCIFFILAVPAPFFETPWFQLLWDHWYCTCFYTRAAWTAIRVSCFSSKSYL